LKRIRKCDLNTVLGDIAELPEFSFIYPERVSVVVSHGSRSKACARIFGLPREIQIGFGIPPLYLIEFVCENLRHLSPERLTTVLIHELLHISPKFSGGLRPHGKTVNDRVAEKIAKRLDSKVGETLYLELKRCCREISTHE